MAGRSGADRWLRPGQRPVKCSRHLPERGALPHAARQGRRAHPAEARLQHRRRGSLLGAHRQGIRISKGRYVTVTREELEAFNPKATRRSRSRLRRAAPDRPIYYAKARTTWCRIAAPRSPTPSSRSDEATNKVGSAASFPATKQYLAAVRPLGGAGDLHHAPCRRSRLAGRARRPARRTCQARRARAEDGGAADRVPGCGVRHRQVQGRLTASRCRAARAQGGGRGNRRGGAAEEPRARSSISWRRCRRAGGGEGRKEAAGRSIG